MHRRTALGSIVTVGSLGLSGCIDRIRALSISTPVLITIENETAVDQSVAITAYALEDGRQTYDEAVTAPPDQTTTLGRLSNFDQQVVVELHRSAVEPDDPDWGEDEDDLVDTEETLVGENTQGLRIIVTDDGVDIDLNQR